ncbi:hypothetical protein K469DRAFT_51141 [Zopfia rhizophila CBS 207.26]|uniref:Uncharacterized protein n=1 Tax=Zopfia rhizophila CBS 207.26 TaxID=1314779 RepID=A0A6A6EFB5_9PEZI|nr:hypothetical protein K469DRAFT_51141 [Zopfia rhizophila CBS 207.26]
MERIFLTRTALHVRSIAIRSPEENHVPIRHWPQHFGEVMWPVQINYNGAAGGVLGRGLGGRRRIVCLYAENRRTRRRKRSSWKLDIFTRLGGNFNFVQIKNDEADKKHIHAEINLVIKYRVEELAILRKVNKGEEQQLLQHVQHDYLETGQKYVLTTSTM